jgi:hypothetical protein
VVPEVDADVVVELLEDPQALSATTLSDTTTARRGLLVTKRSCTA